MVREPEIKAQVRILREALPGLAHQNAYEVLAKLKGYADWNTMSAAFNKQPVVAETFDYSFSLKGDAEWFNLAFSYSKKLDSDAIIETLLNAITSWVETVPEGSDAFSEAGDQLTWELLQAAMSDGKADSIAGYLATRGFTAFELECVAPHGNADFSVFDVCCFDPTFGTDPVEPSSIEISLDERRGQAAAQAFEQHDYGDWIVEETSGWEFISNNGMAWERMVFVKHKTAPAESDTRTARFKIVFKTIASAEVDHVEDGLQPAAISRICVPRIHEWLWTMPAAFVENYACYPVVCHAREGFKPVQSELVLVLCKHSPRPEVGLITETAKAHFCEALLDTRLVHLQVDAEIVEDAFDFDEFQTTVEAPSLGQIAVGITTNAKVILVDEENEGHLVVSDQSFKELVSRRDLQTATRNIVVVP